MKIRMNIDGDLAKFYPINTIFKMMKEGILSNNDVINLCGYNCNLFGYIMLKLPFQRHSPVQEEIFDVFYDPERHYREIVLALGRKSGKTTVAAEMLLFEVYKLLTFYNDPHEHFGLMPKERIYMMLVGPSKEQVQNVSFDYIRGLAESSPYLRSFIERKTNDEIEFQKHLVVRCQTSSSRGGRGYSTAMMLYDELAWFIDNRGNLSGTECFYSMQPNLKPLSPYSRTVAISSPGGRSGIFWELYRSGVQHRVIQETMEHGENIQRVCFQIPTWSANPKLKFNCDSCSTPDSDICLTCPSNELRRDFKTNPEKFQMEFGAFFVDVVSPALPRQAILECATGKMMDMTAVDKTTPRVIGLDPALSGNSYGLTMGHMENGVIIVDLIKYWQGTVDWPVKITLVEEFIEELYKNLNISAIVLDQFQSASTVQHLQSKGIPAYIIHATSKFNETSTNMLINRINLGTIVYPPHKTLLNELSFLQRTQVGKSVRFEASVNSSDDLVDAMCRMTYVLDTDNNRTITVDRI